MLASDYARRGYAAVAHLEREHFIQDSAVINTLLELCLSNDDEEIFNLLLHKIWWGGYYKSLCSLSLEHNTTRYLEKLISVSGSMLFDEMDAQDERYTTEELRIMEEAYAKTEYAHIPRQHRGIY